MFIFPGKTQDDSIICYIHNIPLLPIIKTTICYKLKIMRLPIIKAENFQQNDVIIFYNKKTFCGPIEYPLIVPLLFYLKILSQIDVCEHHFKAY